MTRVRLSADARDFLREEVRYLLRHSPAAAQRLLSRINDARESLSRFPRMGPQADPSPVPGSRRLVVGDYVLDYDFDGPTVSITAIRHGRMAPPPPASEPDFDYEA